MKLAAALFAVALVAIFSSRASALDLEVINKSKTTIHHLYVSAAGENDWGDDQLGDDDDDVIEPGDSYTVEDLDPGRYDIKLISADNAVCVIRNARFGANESWTITDSMLESCG